MKFIGENFILLNFTTDKQVESEVASTTGHASTFIPARSLLTLFSAQAMLEWHPKRFSKPQL